MKRMMRKFHSKKKRVFYFRMTVIVVLLFLFVFSVSKIYQYVRVKYAKVEVDLVPNLNLEVYQSFKLSDLIGSINGKLIKDKVITTSRLGKQHIKFHYINDDGIKVGYDFDVNVVDTTAPLISSSTYHDVKLGYTGDIAKDLFCGDNYDDQPTCQLVGEYDVNTPGEYPVVFVGEDQSGNLAEHELILRVREMTPRTSGGEGSLQGTDIREVIHEYKTKKNQIGIDVSKWQGSIDYQKVKEAGVQFAILRLGSQKGIQGEYVMDSKFKDNIEGFLKVGIPVGVYFFSYADSKEESVKQAKWIVKEIKDYKVELPIVFDWENWSDYQEFHLSFGHLNSMANAFMNEVKKSGYTPMLYGSKNYLEDIWDGTQFPVWLAHYTENTDYKKQYKIWQIMEDGIVDGIPDNTVDIDILYR